MKEIVFEVDKEGKTKADAQGFSGAACTQALAAFRILKNKEAVTVEDKPELYETDKQELEGTY